MTVLKKRGPKPPRCAFHLHNTKHINSDAYNDESPTMTDVVTSTKMERLGDTNNSRSRITPMPEMAPLNTSNDVTIQTVGNDSERLQFNSWRFFSFVLPYTKIYTLVRWYCIFMRVSRKKKGLVKRFEISLFSRILHTLECN